MRRSYEFVEFLAVLAAGGVIDGYELGDLMIAGPLEEQQRETS